MSDKRLHKLYARYEALEVFENHNISFEQFVNFVEMGLWLEAIESERLPLVHKGSLEEVNL